MCWNWSPHGHAGFESKVLLASFSVEVKVKADDNCLLILASMHHNPFSYMMHICRNYIERWVINGKAAKLRTEATAPHLSFDQQCIHCEKVNSNCYFGCQTSWFWQGFFHEDAVPGYNEVYQQTYMLHIWTYWYCRNLSLSPWTTCLHIHG